MANILVQRYNEIKTEIKAELKAIQSVITEPADGEVIREKVAALKAEQAKLQKTLHFTALFHLRDEAWRALSH